MAAMEDVLEVYKRRRNPDYPLVCMDEQPVQLFSETRKPLPVRSGESARFDHEYRREGLVVNFMFSSPLENWRRVSVRQRKTRRDWAEEIRRLADEDFPGAKKIVLVMDNLNTHTS